MHQVIAHLNSEKTGKRDSVGRFSARRLPDLPKQFLAGVAAIFAAASLAWVIYRINAAWTDEPATAASIATALLGVLLIVPPAVYLLALRRKAQLAELGLVIIGTLGALLVSLYLFWASFYIFFPADFLIWSESDFVNDILKFRQNYPLFTPQANNESFTYVPGSQLLTYFLAWLVGQSTSIETFRLIQVFFTFLSTVVSFLCCRRLFKLGFPDRRETVSSPLWGIVWLTGFFLIATNAVTNPFTHLLHNDALAQLLTVIAFWLLAEYEATKKRWILWLMALVPAAGFWVKQSLIVWAILYAAYLLILDRPRSIKKTFYFVLATGFGATISVLIGYALWQNDFVYWVFTVLGAHEVSPLRSFKHLLDVWLYFAIGLFGGAILLEAGHSKRLFGLWVIWLIVILSETYTSGIAWMLNHTGPGCLIAGIWFFAALAGIWPKISRATIETANTRDWLRPGVAVAIVCLLFSGLGVVRVPVRPFDAQDAARYAQLIEKEFAAQPPERTLLDFGTWVYLPSGVVMRDRAATIGERGWSQTGDFSGILERLKQKYYAKILLRNLNSPDFWYDHHLWSRSSDIKKTLFENYKQIDTIKPVAGFNQNEMPYGFGEISVMIPRDN